MGREVLEKVYADCFHTEAALVRPQITCGTHALAVALSANLLPGDELLSPNGAPYDTLEEVIGIRPSKCSLMEYGVQYRQVDLLPDGTCSILTASAPPIEPQNKAHHHPALKGLCNKTVVLRCADRRADRILQTVQTGRSVHGR